MSRKSSPRGEKDRFFTKPIAIIFTTVFIDLVGFGIVIPALPFYVEGDYFAATPLDIGLLFASYSAMQFIFSPILGSLSDKYGRRPVLFLSLLGSAVGYMFMGFATALWMVYLGRIIAGVTGGNISTAQAYIADVTTRKNRAKGMGLFGAAFGLGFVFGPAIGGILSRYGIHVPFLFAAGLTFVNAIALYFVLPESLKKEDRETGRSKNRFAEMFESLKDPRFSTLSLLYFLLVTAFSIMTASFVLYTLDRFGYDAEANGYLFAYIGILAVILQGWLFGKLAHRFGEAWLVVVGSFILGGGFFVLPYIGPDFGGLPLLLVVIGLFAIGNALSSPALTSLASKVASDREQGKALGLMQSGASLARAIGPAIAGVLLNNAMGSLDDFTILRTFWTAAALMFLTFVLAAVFAGRMKLQKV
ncbi:MAG: MFS transporter [Acidobacteria bacterium]|nr:MAG: MFS transporter [Acidobacteriota bacterium]REK02800.1 MAG: MFS transporter [Acidobacteriota bacterium]REK15389.1 MAG: MFS transporter [Acidobacteriota bacterium]REK42108.1 MAG: MFS transporter [Acidobacteriota bacterium]